MKYKDLSESKKLLIEDAFEYLSDYSINLSEEIDDDDETLCVEFPDEMYSSEYSIEELLDYCADIKKLEKESNSTVRSNSIIQITIDSTNSVSPIVTDILTHWQFQNEDVVARVVEAPFLIGVQNCIDDNYWDKYGITPCHDYLALEIKYLKGKRGTKIEEKELVERILYHLTMKVGIAIFTSQFWNASQIYQESDEIDEYIVSEKDIETKTVGISSLTTFTPMMKLYRQALETQDPEIRYLYFYKAIEFISPIVAKRNVFQKINTHLDTYSAESRDYDYINTLLNFASEYRENQKDENLAPEVIHACIDPLPLFEYIPSYLQKTIKHNLRLEPDVDMEKIELDANQQKSLRTQVANILYSTRNSIVHAKSNYEPKGNECKRDDLDTINHLMDSVVRQLIEWHSKLPMEFQIR